MENSKEKDKIGKMIGKIKGILEEADICDSEGDQYGSFFTGKQSKILESVERVLRDYKRRTPEWEKMVDKNLEEYKGDDGYISIKPNSLKKFISKIIDDERKDIFKPDHSPITWSGGNYEKGTEEDVIVGHWAEDSSPYEITLPYQLRDIMISLLNTLCDKHEEIRKEK